MELHHQFTDKSLDGPNFPNAPINVPIVPIPRLIGDALFDCIRNKVFREFPLPLDDYEQKAFESEEYKFHIEYMLALNLNWAFDNFQEVPRAKFKALRMWG